MPPRPTTPNYEKTRMAEVVAEVTSGVKGALPEQDDFDLAARLLEIIEEEKQG